MRRWNVIAMGQVGATGVVMSKLTKPIANSIARRTGYSEAKVLSIIGAGILAISIIIFLRTAEAVIAAGRTATQEKLDPVK